MGVVPECSTTIVNADVRWVSVCGDMLIINTVHIRGFGSNSNVTNCNQLINFNTKMYLNTINVLLFMASLRFHCGRSIPESMIFSP